MYYMSLTPINPWQVWQKANAPNIINGESSTKQWQDMSEIILQGTLQKKATAWAPKLAFYLYLEATFKQLKDKESESRKIISA